jgi:hypothetical protein
LCLHRIEVLENMELVIEDFHNGSNLLPYVVVDDDGTNPSKLISRIGRMYVEMSPGVTWFLVSVHFCFCASIRE